MIAFLDGFGLQYHAGLRRGRVEVVVGVEVVGLSPSLSPAVAALA